MKNSSKLLILALSLSIAKSNAINPDPNMLCMTCKRSVTNISKELSIKDLNVFYLTYLTDYEKGLTKKDDVSLIENQLEDLNIICEQKIKGGNCELPEVKKFLENYDKFSRLKSSNVKKTKCLNKKRVAAVTVGSLALTYALAKKFLPKSKFVEYMELPFVKAHSWLVLGYNKLKPAAKVPVTTSSQTPSAADVAKSTTTNQAPANTVNPAAKTVANTTQVPASVEKAVSSQPVASSPAPVDKK